MTSRIAAVSLTALLLHVPAAGQQFQVDPTALPAQNIWTDGVELVDVNGDGLVDVLFANGQGYGSGGALPQHLFLNQPGSPGTFVAAHGNLNVANFNAKMVIGEDFDNDGDVDLMYAPEGAFPNTTQIPRLLINDGTGVFTDKSNQLPQITMASFCVCAGDVDDDGDLDVVFTDGATFGGAATQARLYRNDGNANFTDITASHLPADTYNAQDVILFDWDGDFDIDIALSGKGQNGKRSRLWLNDGTGHFTVSNILDQVGTGGTYEVDWGDLDGDGDLDGLVQSSSGFSEGWARNDGTSVTESVFPGPNGSDDNEMAALDYDDDGDLDVFIGSLGSTERAYRNDGGGAFANVNAIIQSQGDSTLDLGFADLDGDRTHDMVTAQGESGNWTNKVYKNAGPRDTRPPVALEIEDQPTLTAPRTYFHALLRDAIQDDGHVNVTARVIWATADPGGGSLGDAAARPQGGGLFSARVDSAPNATQLSVAWIATDSVGNATAYQPVASGGANAWTDVGNGHGGAFGRPALTAVGTLAPGTPGRLQLVSARPGRPAFLMVGLAQGDVPFLGGVLVPFPIVLQVNLATDANGEISLPFTWPAGVASGVDVLMQVLVDDSTAAGGIAFSNGLKLTTP